MYLLDPSAAAVNNRKWNLGRLGLAPARFRGLGDDPMDTLSTDPVLNVPVTPAIQNPSPVAGGATNAYLSTVAAEQPSTDPLDYVSPQAAIAAGLDPATVYKKWTDGLARFSSPQAAIGAGVPAGVVNQLWQQSYASKAQAAPSGFSLPSSSTLLLAGGAMLVLAAMSGGKRRR